MILKKKMSSFLFVFILVSSSITLISARSEMNEDIQVTICFEGFRYLEQECEEDAIFRLQCVIDGEQFESSWWDISFFGKTLDWSIPVFVSMDESQVQFSISLLKSVNNEEVICDLSSSDSDDARSVTIIYDLNTGWWTGDDALADLSGYGRVNGCDDGSFYEAENDAEVWFTIIQTDADGDGIPEQIEKEYGTDPFVNDANIDYDQDGIDTYWEWYYGYHPKQADNHYLLDPDNDSISNFEEFITWDLYNSDPFRQDIFLELDWMEPSPAGENSEVPVNALERIKQPFHRRNILFHFDTGIENGGELIPFKDQTSQQEVLEIYNEYFLHNGTYSQRRSIFHYGIVVYLCNMKGYAFSGDTPPYWGYIPGTNGFVISSSQMELNTQKKIFKDRSLDNFYGSAIMHEMGHNFGIRFGEPFGCDNWFAKYPWQPLFWTIRNYKSMMNYQYTYSIFDYSDGSHGWNDFDDWDNIQLTYFEQP
jgi:hypothetical protein